MNRLIRQRKFLIWSLCIALLAVRIAGAHWHLCFDGQELAAAVHAGDIEGIHHADIKHSDVDLNLIDSGLIKLLSKHFASALMFVPLLLLFLFVLRRTTTAIPYREKYCIDRAFRNTPPPRAPPL